MPADLRPAHRRTSRRLWTAAATALLGVVTGTSLAAPSATAGTAGTADNVVLQWDQALLQAVKSGRLGPPMVARAIGTTHTCIYDAWAAYDARALGTRLGGTLRRPAAERTTVNKALAVSWAAYAAISDLYPASTPSLDALMRRLGYDPSVRPTGTAPGGVGLTACQAVLDYRHHDGSNQLGDLHGGPYTDYTGYQALNDPMPVFAPFDPATVKNPDHYQPLIHPLVDGSTQTDGFVGAQWGKVRLFALQGVPEAVAGQAQTGLLDVLRARYTPGPATYGSDRYRQQAADLVAISAGLTDTQKTIAEYWADGAGTYTPAGHWMEMTQAVSRSRHDTLDDDVKLFFMVGNAEADAAVAAWSVKRYYDSVRPVTAIRFLDHGTPVQAWGGSGNGTVTMDGGSWRPYQAPTFPTPPFPEYVSGHSAFSFAAAAALKAFTGSDAFTYSVTVPSGAMTFDANTPAAPVTLSWHSFSEIAAQVGMSRRYGGIHFEDGDLHGRALGGAMGSLTTVRALSLINGVG